MITYAPTRIEMLDNPTAHRYQIQDERGYTLISSDSEEEIKKIFYNISNDFLAIAKYYRNSHFFLYDSKEMITRVFFNVDENKYIISGTNFVFL